MLERILFPILQRQKKSILLLGPRQVGKSTLLQHLKPDLIINLAREREFLDHSSQPELLEELINAANPQCVMIDEIQRIPSLLNTIQAIIDERKNQHPIKFLLSGSSARKLKRGQANLLPGRIISYNLGGISALEIEGKLNLKKSLAYGFLPEVFLEKDSEQAANILLSYSGTYLREEVQAELLVRNIHGFSRFLTEFAKHSGKVLDLSKVASKAKVSRTGAARFLEILEETLLIIKCESFKEIEQTDTISHPKYYFFDPGVLNGLLGGFVLTQDRIGLLFEHTVIAQLKNTASATHKPIDFYYFRTRNGLEVDFIIRVANKTWAIEVKSGGYSAQDTKTLNALRHYNPEIDAYVVVVPDSPTRKLKNGIQVASLSKLLSWVFESQ